MYAVNRGNFGENCPKWRLITLIFGYFLPGTSNTFQRPQESGIKYPCIRSKCRVIFFNFFSPYPIFRMADMGNGGGIFTHINEENRFRGSQARALPVSISYHESVFVPAGHNVSLAAKGLNSTAIGGEHGDS